MHLRPAGIESAIRLTASQRSWRAVALLLGFDVLPRAPQATPVARVLGDGLETAPTGYGSRSSAARTASSRPHGLFSRYTFSLLI
jgi:hypothetical protein